MKEVYALMRVLNGCSYEDAMNMPTRDRKYFLHLFLNENEESESQDGGDNNGKIISQGKGKRTRQVSGEALKQKMKNGEIPNQ